VRQGEEKGGSNLYCASDVKGGQVKRGGGRIKQAGFNKGIGFLHGRQRGVISQQKIGGKRSHKPARAKKLQSKRTINGENLDSKSRSDSPVKSGEKSGEREQGGHRTQKTIHWKIHPGSDGRCG